MADPIIISQIVSSLGLTGETAENKRKELEKLSNEDLIRILGNIQTYKKTNIGNFSSLESTEKYSGEIFNTKVQDTPFLDIALTSSQPTAPHYSTQEQKELDRFLGDFILNSSISGLQKITDYNKSIGWLNITDRAVNGFKVITGMQNRVDLQNELNDEVKRAKELRKTAYTHPGAFESQIERLYERPYSHNNVNELKKASEEFTRVTVYHEKTQLLRQGFSDVKNILRQEQEYEQARKFTRGPAAVALDAPNPSSHEKFGEVLLQLCNGDRNLVNEYMKKLSSEMGSRKDIEKNLPQIMDEMLEKCEEQEKKALGNKSYSQYEQEYNTACKKVLGDKNYKEISQRFVQNAKTEAQFIEIGLSVATSLLLPEAKYAQSFLQKAAKTGSIVSIPAALSVANTATSETGFTEEKVSEIKEKFKSGFVYGGFGAFVSGPLGMAMEKALTKNPSLISNIVGKSMGATTETTADILFDRITSDLSFQESLKQNGVINFGMMFTGGRISKSRNQQLNNLKIAQDNKGNYVVKDNQNKVLLETKDTETLAGFVIAKGIDTPDIQSAKDKPLISEKDILQLETFSSQRIKEINEKAENLDMPKDRAYMDNVLEEYKQNVDLLLNVQNSDGYKLILELLDKKYSKILTSVTNKDMDYWESHVEPACSYAQERFKIVDNRLDIKSKYIEGQETTNSSPSIEKQNINEKSITEKEIKEMTLEQIEDIYARLAKIHAENPNEYNRLWEIFNLRIAELSS